MIDLAQIQKHLLYDFRSEQELVNAINEMAHNFTQNRDKIGDYVLTEKMVSAYCCFYLATNLPKLAAVLDYINVDSSYFKEFDIIDIGSGPGTFTLAWLEYLPQNSYFCLEQAALMRQQGEKLVAGLYPKANVVFQSSLKLAQKTKPRLGIFGHSANEMKTTDVLQYIKQCELDEILFIEPGTKEYYQTAMNTRDELISKGFNIHYPCRANSTCPLTKEDWCHQFLKISHTDDIKRLCQLVKKDRSLLPISIQYYSKKEKKRDESAVITRMYKPTKFSIEMDLCQVDQAGGNQVIKAQQLTRSLKKKQIKELTQKYAGQKITFTSVKSLEQGVERGEFSES